MKLKQCLSRVYMVLKRCLIKIFQPLDPKTAFRDDRVQVALAAIATRERNKFENRRMDQLNGVEAGSDEAKLGLPSSTSAPARLSEQGVPQSPQQSYLAKLRENATRKDIEALEVHGDAIDDFLTCLTVCHTVVVERQKDGSLTYQAESPDEGALYMGQSHWVLNLLTTATAFLCLLKVCLCRGENGEAASIRNTRKRMSIVVRDNRNGQLSVLQGSRQ